MLFRSVGLVVAFWKVYLFDQGRYNPMLFRGGFFVVGLLTLLVIAAVTHRYAAAGELLGNPLMKWIGTRSYGLYLYHWPIYEIIRKQAQIELSVVEFVFAMVVTCVVTEVSYRFIEVPIRQGHIRDLRARILQRGGTIVAGVAVLGVVALAAVSLVNASTHCVGEVACSLAANTTDTTSTTAAPVGSGSTTSSSTTTTTTIQLVPDKYVAIGDSVMVGARRQLTKGGFVVNAKENRGEIGRAHV